MEIQDLVLCDTNIFIEFYKNNKQIIKQIKKIGTENICISVISAAELLFGAFNKKELSIIKKDISSLTLLNIDDNISNIFIKMMEKYSLSHRIAIPDCLIASTSISYSIPLFTLNKKDFHFIENIKLY